MEPRDEWRNPTTGTPEGTARDAARMGEEMKDRARGLAGQAREASGRLADKAKEQANRLVEDRKGQAVSSLDSLSSVLRDSAGRLRGEQSFFGDYAEGAAERVDRLARYLRESEPEQFLRDAESLARRRPEVFMGGMFVTGLLLARFLKSSGHGGDEYAAAGGGSMGGGALDRDFTTEPGGVRMGGAGTGVAGRRADVDTAYQPESGSYGGRSGGSTPGTASTTRPNRGADIAPDDESGLGA